MSICPGPIGRIDTAMRLFVSYWPTVPLSLSVYVSLIVSLSHCLIFLSSSLANLFGITSVRCQSCCRRLLLRRGHECCCANLCRQWGILYAMALCRFGGNHWTGSLDSTRMLIIPNIEAPLCLEEIFRPVSRQRAAARDAKASKHCLCLPQMASEKLSFSIRVCDIPSSLSSARLQRVLFQLSSYKRGRLDNK